MSDNLLHDFHQFKRVIVVVVAKILHHYLNIAILDPNTQELYQRPTKTEGARKKSADFGRT